MASYQYVFVMKDMTKAYPGGKVVLEKIWLSFLPGVKIGVLGPNGSGKSTLMRIMGGIDKEFTGEAWVAQGATVGYLSQEPELDPAKTVAENVMEGLAPIKALVEELTRYNRTRWVHVFFGAKDRDDLYDLPELNKLAARYPWLSVVPACSDDRNFVGEQGNIGEVVARYGPWGDHDFFVSGSATMVKNTRKRSRAKTPPDPRKHRAFMRSYATDADGNRVLIGLTLAETVEYEDYRD